MMVDKIALLAYLFGHIHGVSGHTLQLMSPAYKNNGAIPKLYTCQAKNISMPLGWKGVPFGSQSLVVVMDEQTASGATRYDWVMYNIPPQLTSLPAGVKHLSLGERLGRNSWGKIGYHGPCSAGQHHRYVVTLYTVNRLLRLPNGASARQVHSAMRGHVIDQARISGYF